MQSSDINIDNLDHALQNSRMENYQDISSDEQIILNSAINSLSERAKYPLSLDELVRKWYSFVAQVKNGYDDSIYEYINDLSVRDLLYQILKQVPKSLSYKIITLLAPIDDGFKEATRKIDCPLIPLKDINEDQYWWFRIPKELTDELKEDIKSYTIWGDDFD